MAIGNQVVSSTLTRSLIGAGILRRRPDRNGVESSRTRMRIDSDVAQRSAQRLGTLAILTAVSVVGITIGQQLLQSELAEAHRAPLFRFSALFLVLASIGLAALQRTKWISPQSLLDLGLVFEVVGALLLGVMENCLPWPDNPVRGCAAVAAWIALCVLLIPNRPWKSTVAAVLSALTVPFAHLVCSYVLSYPPLPWGRLGGYSLGPLFIAGWAPFISSRVHEMQKELSRAGDLGSYHVEQLLGRGGMGEVWRARHHLLRRQAAVKVVLPELLLRTGWSEQRRIRERFEHEAQAIASLSSPHTVSLFDFGISEDGALYYVMELLDGMDAESLVNQYGSQPASRVIHWIRQACESLEEAHELGLIHRDIKPSNLFVCRLGKRTDFVKLLDFGLVKMLQTSGQTRLTSNGESSGTPAFMAPEQVRGESEIDSRADIYGLGAIAYFLLTGLLVFDGPTPLAMAIAQIENTPAPPSMRSELPIPASLERVVMACLEKKPEHRPQSAAELAHLLGMCADVPQWTEDDANRWWSLHRPRSTVRRAS